MKRFSPFVTVLLSVVVLTFVAAILAPFAPMLTEAFGAQGGEMVQLAASRVPTRQDVRAWRRAQRQIQRDLFNLTGSY
jgi:hypothetical protein